MLYSECIKEFIQSEGLRYPQCFPPPPPPTRFFSEEETPLTLHLSVSDLCLKFVGPPLSLSQFAAFDFFVVLKPQNIRSSFILYHRIGLLKRPINQSMNSFTPSISPSLFLCVSVAFCLYVCLCLSLCLCLFPPLSLSFFSSHFFVDEDVRKSIKQTKNYFLASSVSVPVFLSLS